MIEVQSDMVPYIVLSIFELTLLLCLVVWGHIDKG